MTIPQRRDLELLLSELEEHCRTYAFCKSKGDMAGVEKCEALAEKVHCRILDEFYRLTEDKVVDADWWEANHKAVQPYGNTLRILRIAKNDTIEIRDGDRGLNIGHPSIEQVIRLSFALSDLKSNFLPKIFPLPEERNGQCEHHQPE